MPNVLRAVWLARLSRNGPHHVARQPSGYYQYHDRTLGNQELAVDEDQLAEKWLGRKTR